MLMNELQADFINCEHELVYVRNITNNQTILTGLRFFSVKFFHSNNLSWWKNPILNLLTSEVGYREIQ